jgi:hypothetical protein
VLPQLTRQPKLLCLLLRLLLLVHGLPYLLVRCCTCSSASNSSIQSTRGVVCRCGLLRRGTLPCSLLLI